MPAFRGQSGHFPRKESQGSTVTKHRDFLFLLSAYLEQLNDLFSAPEKNLLWCHIYFLDTVQRSYDSHNLLESNNYKN